MKRFATSDDLINYILNNQGEDAQIADIWISGDVDAAKGNFGSGTPPTPSFWGTGLGNLNVVSDGTGENSAIYAYAPSTADYDIAIYAQSDAHFGTGILGYNDDGVGVDGESGSGKGIFGFSSTGIGVNGASPAGFGGHFTSSTATGLFASSTTEKAAVFEAAGSLPVISALNSGTGRGIDITTEAGAGVYASSQGTAGVFNSSSLTAPALSVGANSGVGLLVGNNGTSDLIVASNGSDVFTVSGSGDVTASGDLITGQTFQVADLGPFAGITNAGGTTFYRALNSNPTIWYSSTYESNLLLTDSGKLTVRDDIQAPHIILTDEDSGLLYKLNIKSGDLNLVLA